MAESPGREHRHRVVCKDRGVPPGWVVIGECQNPACVGTGVNGWVVKRPGRRELVCDSSPVPDGWERIRRSECSSCPGDGENAWVIERIDHDRG